MTKSKYRVHPPVSGWGSGPQFTDITTDEELQWLEACAHIDNENLQKLLDHFGIPEGHPARWMNLCKSMGGLNLQELLDHFGIQHDIPGRWKRLAVALSRDPAHITARECPFLKKLPLRPKKKKIKPETKNTNHRPPKTTDFERGLFVHMVDEYKKKYDIKHDKAALEKIYDDRVAAIKRDAGLTEEDKEDAVKYMREQLSRFRNCKK